MARAKPEEKETAYRAPRLRTNMKRSRVPRKANDLWANGDTYPQFTTSFATKQLHPQKPQADKRYTHVQALQDMQRYALKDPVVLTEDAVLWKGMDPSREGDRALVATSTRPEVAFRFDYSRKGLYRIHVPKGTPVMPVHNEFLLEHEILLFPGRLERMGPTKEVDIATRTTPFDDTGFKRRAVTDMRYVPSLGKRGRPTLNPENSHSTLSLGSSRAVSYRSDPVTQQASSGSITGSQDSTGRKPGAQSRAGQAGAAHTRRARAKQPHKRANPRQRRGSGSRTRRR